MGDTPRRPQAPGPSENALRGRPSADVGDTVTLLNPENGRKFVYEISKLTDAIADQIRLGKLEVVDGEFPEGALDPVPNPVDPADDASQDDDGGDNSDDEPDPDANGTPAADAAPDPLGDSADDDPDADPGVPASEGV